MPYDDDDDGVLYVAGCELYGLSSNAFEEKSIMYCMLRVVGCGLWFVYCVVCLVSCVLCLVLCVVCDVGCRLPLLFDGV